MNIVDELQITAIDDRRPQYYFGRARLLEMITRIVPSAFFLFIVLLKFAEQHAFSMSSQGLGNEDTSWRFFAYVISRASTICFLGLMSILFLVRLEPIDKAKGITPRVIAIAGTFFVAIVVFFPRADLTTTEVVIASLLSLVGTGTSVIALAHLGRSFSIMAEARKLVTSGPYRIVRHPLYIFEGIASLGVLLQFLNLYTLLIFLCYALLQFQRMRNEEAILEKAFPEYQAYKSTTARLIPGLY